MANAKAKEEAETSPEKLEEESKEESQEEQPSEEEETVSEDEKTPSEPDRGDLSVALKQEREKRQNLERQWNNPDSVFQAAKELGLTQPEAEAQEIPQEGQPQEPQPQAQQAPNIFPLMDDFYKYKEEVKKFPEAESSPEIAGMIDGLVQGGKKPAEAVKAVQKELGKQAEKLKLEETKKQEAEESDQEKAQTAGVDHDVSSDVEEMTDLVKRSKSLDPSVQKEAMIELMKKKNKKEGII